MHRFEAYLDWRGTGSEALSTWCFDNMASIFGVSWHLKEGEPHQELSWHVDQGGVYRANMFLTEADAVAGFNLLSDQNVAGLTRQPDGDEDPASSLRVHECFHDQTPSQPCNQQPMTAEWSR